MSGARILSQEERRIVLCGEAVSYTLSYKTVRRINVRIREEGVFVSAPPTSTRSEIERFLRENERRILFAIRQCEKSRDRKGGAQYPVTYESGESVLYMGKRYNLAVEKATRQAVTVQNGEIRLLVTNPSDESLRHRTFDTWWLTQCRSAMERLCRAIYPIYEARGVPFPQIKVRPMVSQWGNCRPTRGIVTFNARLLAAPVQCMEYVALHEFTHFLYPNHSRQFYAFLSGELPDWEKRRDMLENMVSIRGV